MRCKRVYTHTHSVLTGDTHTCILAQRSTHMLLRDIYNHGHTEAGTHRQGHTCQDTCGMKKHVCTPSNTQTLP